MAKSTLEHVAPLPTPEGAAARPWLAAKARALLSQAQFAVSRGRGHETKTSAEASAALARRVDDPRALVQALAMQGMGIAMMGEVAGARAALDEGIRLAREHGYRYELAYALGSLAFVLFATDNMTGYKELLDETYHLGREVGNLGMMGMNAMGTARYAAATGDWQTASTKFDEAEEVFRQMRDNESMAIARSEMGHALRNQRRFAEALAVYRETIRTWQEVGQRAAVAHELESMAFVARAVGEARRAAVLLGAAEALRERINAPMAPAEQVEHARETDKLREQMDAAELAAAWAEGQAMTMDEAVEYALEPYEPGLTYQDTNVS
jgi:hypothetical protein